MTRRQAAARAALFILAAAGLAQGAETPSPAPSATPAVSPPPAASVSPAASPTPAPEVRWGRESRGLVVGLAPRRPAFAAGEALEFECRLKNASDRALRLPGKIALPFTLNCAAADGAGGAGGPYLALWDPARLPNLPPPPGFALAPGEEKVYTLVLGAAAADPGRPGEAVLCPAPVFVPRERVGEVGGEALPAGTLSALPAGSWRVTAGYGNQTARGDAGGAFWQGKATSPGVAIEIGGGGGAAAPPAGPGGG